MLTEEQKSEVRVGTAMSPATYRVFADTRLSEVAELMVRKDLRSVPVVGERFELLGVISSAQLLVHFTGPGVDTASSNRGAGADGGEAGSSTARELMTRSVMCVSPETDIGEAAKAMAARGVDILGVVADGELVGILCRDALLRTLFPPD